MSTPGKGQTYKLQGKKQYYCSPEKIAVAEASSSISGATMDDTFLDLNPGTKYLTALSFFIFVVFAFPPPDNVSYYRNSYRNDLIFYFNSFIRGRTLPHSSFFLFVAMEVDGEGWACDSCTFENNGQDVKCEMCGSEQKPSSTTNAGKKPTTAKSRDGGSQSQELDSKADVASRPRRKRRAASRGDDEDEYEGEPASRYSGTDLIGDAPDDERLNRLVAQMQKLNKKT